MNFIFGFVLCLVVMAGIWAGALALYRNWGIGEDLRRHPHFLSLSSVPLLMVTGLSFAPFLYGYLLSLLVWWFTVKNLFELPWDKAIALFLILAVLSGLAYLAVLALVAVS